MKLKLVLEQTGKSWTLKPNREYFIGSSQDCDIVIPDTNVVSRYHLKFSFNSVTSTWHIHDLSSGQGTFVNDSPITDYPIQHSTKISLARQVVLSATPEGNAIANVSPPTTNQVPSQTEQAFPPPPPFYSPGQSIPTPPPTTPVSPPVTSTRSDIGNGRSNQPTVSQKITPKLPSYPLKILSWKQYVNQQVRKQSNWFSRFATRYYLITGFRNTPWIRDYGQRGFRAFDGYVIPDFQGSAEEVASEVEQQLSQLRNYEGTDCFVTMLTDGHIADSATQTFLGVELFAIKRDRKSDYRRFCVIAYHRVRTYLLVEKYGTDLFVSWITRFEPDPTPLVPWLWFTLSCLLSLILLFAVPSDNAENAMVAIIPLLIWLAIYQVTPSLMEKAGVVPKKANGRLFTFLSLLLCVFLLNFLVIIYYLIKIVVKLLDSARR